MITLVLVPSTALLALWAAMTTVMLVDIRDLHTTAALTEELGGPVVSVVGQLQRERRATMDTASPSQASLLRLERVREETDEALSLYRRRMDGFDAADLSRQAQGLDDLLDELDGHRELVDGLPRSGRTPLAAGTFYDQAIETGLRFWDGQVTRADPEQVPHLRSLTSLMLTRELLNQQDSVVAHAVASDSFTTGDHARFAAAAGAQQFTWNRAGTELSDADLREYARVSSFTGLATVHLLQDNIVGSPPVDDDTVPVNASAWHGAAEAVDLRMREAEQAQMERVVALSNEQAAELTRVVAVSSVLVLIAALASTAVAVSGTQRLGLRLQELRTLTLEHARVRLPEVTARLRAGEIVDVDAEAPRLRVERRDEIGEVAEAFNDAQRAAVTAAVEEAKVRAGVRAMFRTWRGARSRWCTASCGCWTRWSAARPTPRRWRRCFGSTTSAPRCAATRRTSCCSAVTRRCVRGWARWGCTRRCGRRPARSRTTRGCGCWRFPGCGCAVTWARTRSGCWPSCWRTPRGSRRRGRR
ncbi:nitrate- and nitrite sensing domain-containing protein [Nocardiopsis sp. CNR-923]|uniref:nitrate- and nitrite sensing domain-containing protein n=1 Tax=Nocardiopsis sp. CNR-923 TaxID=1904965 RepID=UPI0021CCA773|nr:nitrate- and nitrite sensing domain-containing protein [Nocardiopsis sp. CNR-923]